MSDSVEYAKMIGVPTNSCEYVYTKRRNFLKKSNLIKKINSDLENDSNHLNDKTKFAATTDLSDDKNELIEKDAKSLKKERRLGAIITAQIVAALCLAVAIILTNIFWENSGMNTLFKSVFGGESITQQIADERVYSDFSLNLPVKEEGVTLVKGVINIDGNYAIYPVCEGTVKKVEKATDGTYTVTIKHSDSFSSIIEGADLVYFATGEKINKNVPVCHTSKKAAVYLYENGNLLTDYAAVENTIVFNK